MFGESEKNVSKLKEFWVEFFADRRDGGHRFSLGILVFIRN